MTGAPAQTASPAAFAYTVTDLGTFTAVALNDQQDVVGNPPTLVPHASAAAPIVHTGDSVYHVRTINDAGKIGGQDQSAPGMEPVLTLWDTSGGHEFVRDKNGLMLYFAEAEALTNTDLLGYNQSVEYGRSDVAHVRKLEDPSTDIPIYSQVAFQPYSGAYGDDLYSVNGAGDVTGVETFEAPWVDHSKDPPPVYSHAFLMKSGEITDLGTLPADTQSVGRGINNHDDVVGTSGALTPGQPGGRAVLWHNGTLTSLSSAPSDAFGVNDSGQIVGASGGSAFLYEAGTMHDLSTLTATRLDSAVAINCFGDIVANGGGHAYLLSRQDVPRTQCPP